MVEDTNKLEEDILTKDGLLKKFNLESNCNLRTACNLIILEHVNYSFSNPDVSEIINTANELLKSGDNSNLIISSYILNSLELK
jgi:hypothetical protein